MLLECILFIAKTNQSIRMIDNDDFTNLLSSFNSHWRSPSHTTVLNQFIPVIATAIKQYIISRLKGHSVTLILDERKNSNRSYINFIVAINMESFEGVEMYFWECMEASTSTAWQISRKLCEVTDELESYGIICQSFATDNCRAMIKAKEYYTTKVVRQITHMPSVAYILNNVLKGLFTKSRKIQKTWDLVLFFYFSFKSYVGL